MEASDMQDRIRGRARRLGLITALVMAVAIPATALADTGGGSAIDPRASHGATADIDGVTLNNKLMATIDFRVRCDPITYFDYETWQEVTTTEGRLGGAAALLQAQGRTIAAANGSVPQADVTCDGSTVNSLSVSVIAQSLPLKRGAALAGVSVFISAGESGEDSASTGPTSIKLR